MSPDMCPDMICDIDVSDYEVQLYNQIPDSVLEQYKQINACKEFTLNLKLKECHCELCRHDYKKIGIKKSIKWNSKMYNYYKKELKKLRDKGIRSGSLTSKNILEIKYAIVKEMALYHCEQSCLLRFRRHACKMRYRRQRYERYKQLGILY